MLDRRLDDRAEVFAECISACERCIEAFGDRPEMAICARACDDCIILCAAAANLCAMNSVRAYMTCRACADACEACATECDRHDGARFRNCAEACRRCAASARLPAA